MNKKLIVANLMLAVLATACGDSTYVPNGNVPFGQGTVNGFPNQPFNPMLNQPFANQPIMNQPFNWQNPQQQMILQNQLQWQAQMQAQNTGCFPQIQNTGCFPQYRTTGCFPQTRPTCSSVYTNYYAPNRQYIVSSDNRLHSTGYYVVTSSGRGRRKCYKAVPIYTYSSNRSVDVKCLTCSDSGNSTVATSTTTVTTTTTHGSSSGGTVVTGGNTSSPASNDVRKDLPIRFGGVPEDFDQKYNFNQHAKALYDRLNVSEVKDTEELNGKKVNVLRKKGKNLACIKTTDELLEKNRTYMCYFQINTKEFNVLNIATSNTPLKSSDKGYKTPENYEDKSKDDSNQLVIGGEQRGMDEAVVTFGKLTNHEEFAKDLFESISASEVREKRTGSTIDIVSKTQNGLKCYRTFNTDNDGYYCEVKLQPSTGLIQADYSAAAPSSDAQETDNTGKDQTQSEKVNPASGEESKAEEPKTQETKTEEYKT